MTRGPRIPLMILPVLGLISSLLFLEILIRILPPKMTQIDFSLQKLKWYFTPTRNAYKPFISFPYNWLGGNNTVWRFNDLGFRDRSTTAAMYSKQDESVYRIVFIGDSVTMGAGVEDWEAFPSQVEKLLQFTKSSPETNYFEVMNLGISGYGTVQYEEVLRTVGLKLRPDMVILGVLPFNDPLEAAFFEVNKKYDYYRSLPDTVLTPKINNFFLSHSYLYLALLSRYYSFINKYTVPFEEFIKSAPKEQLVEKGWLISDFLIQKMKDELDRSNIKFVVLGFPHSRDVYLKRESLDMPRLKMISNKLNINYLDMSPVLMSYPRYDDLFINKTDIHFTTIGHKVVASEIVKYLRSRELVPVETR